jgi:dihydropyrimidinase
MSILIQNAEVVSATETKRTNVRIEDEKITAVGSDVVAESGDEIVEGSDQLLIPGGVDPHVHMALPFMGTV